MNNDYLKLKTLVESPGWAVLQTEWLHQVSKIEEARDRAASRGQESAWRYWSGQEKGFKVAVTAHLRALEKMEQEASNQETNPVNALLDELKIPRGENP